LGISDLDQSLDRIPELFFGTPDYSFEDILRENRPRNLFPFGGSGDPPSPPDTPPSSHHLQHEYSSSFEEEEDNQP